MHPAKYEKFLGLRPVNVRNALPGSLCGLASGRDIALSASLSDAIVMACNIRHHMCIPGILRAARKADSVVMLELAKSEATYTGVSFENLPGIAAHVSSLLGDGIVFGLHMDHFAVKSPAERDHAMKAIPAAIAQGWTSVAIDASHNPDWENLSYTRDVALSIPPYIGLEAEVGEIRGGDVLTTVQEAEYFVGGLNSWGVFPDFLAISNGSKHGTYDSSAGESEGINLARTGEIAKAIERFGCVIAQHGISGTPLHKVGLFNRYGIRKGNVGTLWQNILFGLDIDPESGNAHTENGRWVKRPDRGIPMELWNEMTAHADSMGMSGNSGDYKKLNLPFHHRIMAVGGEYRTRIIDETERWALRFFEAFNSIGTATRLVDSVVERGDWNSTPSRKIIVERGLYGPHNAPDAGTVEAVKGDFSD